MESAHLKIERAAKHLSDLNNLFREKRPFCYVLEIHAKSGQRATFAKTNEPVINQSGLIVGDIIHNLRSALDHAYWAVVSPTATTDREVKSIQFPFSATAAGLRKAVSSRLAQRVSQGLVNYILGLRAHGEAGGNQLLYLVHELDVVDKHRLLIPVGDYTRVSAAVIRKQVPDFPGSIGGVMRFGSNYRDVTWSGAPLASVYNLAADGMFEQELDIPVDIVFKVGPQKKMYPVIPTLDELVDVIRSIVVALEAFA